MLVIVSDLHLCDGTAYEQNVTEGSFALLQKDIYDLAARYRAKKLDIVFLGDVFDLLRTNAWFAASPNERPWGEWGQRGAGAITGEKPPAAVLARANQILDAIIDKNKNVLAALRGLAGANVTPPPDCDIRRIYLPGNHDRLYLHDDTIRRKVREQLGAADETKLAGEGIYPHRIQMKEYGLLARHGHEWDLFNFQRFNPEKRAGDYSDEDYLATPIGDPITTELVAALPYELDLRLRGNPVMERATDGTTVRERVVKRMQAIEDVRPLMSALQWPFYKAQRMALANDEREAVCRALTDATHTLAARFLEMPYFQQWYSSEHSDFHFDVPFGFKAVLEAMRVIGFDTIDRFKKMIAELAAKAQGDDHDSLGAMKEDLASVGDKGMRFVVYGHTHEPLEIAMRAGATEDVYLNSGTWRRREFLTDDQLGFIGWENFCYLAFYGPSEQLDAAQPIVPRIGPAYECWMGSRGK